MALTLLGRCLATIYQLGVGVQKRFMFAYFKNILASVGEQCDLDSTLDCRYPQQISLGERTIIKSHVILNGRSTARKCGIKFDTDVYIKEYNYLDSYGGFIEIVGPCAIGQFCVFHGGGGLQIGKYVMFGPQCSVIASNHIFDDLEMPYMLQGDRRRGIIIEDNVWIGGGSVILDGVRVGRNAVIGAGAIVTKDIPANSIYVDRRPKLLKGALHRHSSKS